MFSLYVKIDINEFVPFFVLAVVTNFLKFKTTFVSRVKKMRWRYQNCENFKHKLSHQIPKREKIVKAGSSLKMSKF